jgi:hypothetical protein
MKRGTVLSYEDQMHRLGRITGGMALLLIFAVPTVVCVYFDVWPPLHGLLKGLGMVCMIYLPVGLAEALTYTPLLGSGGSYLVFVTGNLTNLKIPCATMCMDAAGVKPGTEEGDVVSTIAIAVSSIVTTLIIVVGVLALVPLRPVLESPALKPAFDNILPALFGGLGAYWVSKQWKLALVPLAVVVLVSIFLQLDMFVLMVIGVPISILAARLMYKSGWIKGGA